MFSSDVRLSERQLQILRLVAEGMTRPEIASRVYLAPSTVGYYQCQMLEALGARNAAHAVHQAHLLGLLPH